MNRLEELKKQATEDILGVKILNADIFAELLVRECAEVALREDHEPDACILTHFGFNR